MTLYDYEVAIYQELNGSNSWNGSVIAVMLLSGSLGAMVMFFFFFFFGSRVLFDSLFFSSLSFSRSSIIQLPTWLHLQLVDEKKIFQLIILAGITSSVALVRRDYFVIVVC
jgi:hypothetical protein